MWFIKKICFTLRKSINIFEKYENNRQERKNNSCICSLICQNSVEEFISYVNNHNIISLSREIFPSIFESNSFIIENKNITLIWHAFLGLFQIFQYLFLHKVEITQNKLWLYSIHYKNSEMIHYLESNKVSQPTFRSRYFANEDRDESIFEIKIYIQQKR